MVSDASKTLNVAGYLFVSLDDLPGLRERLQREGAAREVRGTILLAPEGINLFVAGDVDRVREFVGLLRTDARLAPLVLKESWSDAPPFRRFRVRLKKEIITMKHPAISPESGRAPAVDSQTLKLWLDQGHDDEGRVIIMLDTRNGYEVEQGTFRGALDPGIRHFSEFPAALEKMPEVTPEKVIVTFCTGGIRCEKAALYMREKGFGNVLQLDGGILKYFEETGGAHYDGRCFVFDNRVSLNPDLSPEAPEGVMREGLEWEKVG
jgi:UPF0176 protein